jgi:hypothetical protein
MSSAEDGYCSADSPRAESGDEQLADAEVSPRAGAGRSKRDRDISLPSSPLPAAKRRYELFSCAFSQSVACFVQASGQDSRCRS